MSAGWTAARAEAVAREALARNLVVGEVGALELIRLGTNGVFLTRGAILRVSPPNEDPHLVQQQLDLASWLTDRGFPTARPLHAAAQLVDGLLVTDWEYIESRSGIGVDRRAFGQLVRRFHEATNAYQGELPAWEPLGRLGTRLDTVPADDAFSEQDRALLCGWRDRLIATATDVAWELPWGPLHGDVHTGNVIVSGAGQFLVDLDRIARGPREWDLTQPVGASERFGGARSELDEFMDGYGWDLREFNGHEALVQLRLLFMTSWLLTLPRSPRVKREIINRLLYWRDGPSAPLWHPV